MANTRYAVNRNQSADRRADQHWATLQRRKRDKANNTRKASAMRKDDAKVEMGQPGGPQVFGV